MSISSVKRGGRRAAIAQSSSGSHLGGEAAVQRFAHKWLELHDILHTHPPNGEARDPITANILKSYGVRAGIPDMLCFVPCYDPGSVINLGRGVVLRTQARQCGGLALELKRDRREGPVKVSDAQREVLPLLAGYGWRVAVSCGVDETLEVLESAYGGYKKGRGELQP